MVLNDNKNHCFYCERPFNVAHYGTNKPCAKTRDHIIPVAKGGNSKPINMVYSCIECNNLKSNLSLQLFVSRVHHFIDENKTYKTIPETRLHLIINKAISLISYVEEKGNELYTSSGIPHRPKKKKQSLVGEYLERHPKKVVSKKIRQMCADVTLSVNTNTSTEKTRVENLKDEYSLYLQKQTPEQFLLAEKHGWKVAKQLTATEPNFHYL